MLSARLGSFAFREGTRGCGAEAPGAALSRFGGPGEAGGAWGRLRGAARAGGLPPPEPLRSAEPGARRRCLARRGRGARSLRLAEPDARSGDSQSPLACPWSPPVPGGRFCTCRAVCSLGGGRLWGSHPGPDVWRERPESAWVAGGDPVWRAELGRISGQFGERHMAGPLGLRCRVAEKGIPIESWQTFLE